jgi:hypothetical protein
VFSGAGVTLYDDCAPPDGDTLDLETLRASTQGSRALFEPRSNTLRRDLSGRAPGAFAAADDVIVRGHRRATRGLGTADPQRLVRGSLRRRAADRGRRGIVAAVLATCGPATWSPPAGVRG